MYLPSLETFFEEAIEQADPEAMIEDDFKWVIIKPTSFIVEVVKLGILT